MATNNGPGVEQTAGSSDPGWGGVFRVVFPGRRQSAAHDALTILRALFLWLFMAPVLITFVLALITDRVVPDSMWAAPVAAGLAVLSIVLPRLVMRRAIEAGDETSFLNWYRTTFFLAFALCEAPFLVAFVLCFAVDALLPVLIALPGFLIGMLGIAPTRRNLDALQSRVLAGGSPVNVLEALTRPVKAS